MLSAFYIESLFYNSHVQVEYKKIRREPLPRHNLQVAPPSAREELKQQQGTRPFGRITTACLSSLIIWRFSCKRYLSNTNLFV